MNAKTKKTIVGILATIVSIISALLWSWFARLPSFDQVEQSFNEIGNATFQDYRRK